MGIPKKYLATMDADGYYHIYGRSNNRELLFRSPENYTYFLDLYARYIGPLCKTLSWCLLPNHFHFLLRIRSLQAILNYFSAPPGDCAKNRPGLKPTVHQTVSNAFRSLFTSYAMGFNKSSVRSGNLFHRPFKRIIVPDERQLINTAIYLHANPQYHGLTLDYQSYPWSSYSFILDHESLPEPAHMLSLFGGRNEFIGQHKGRAHFLPATAIEETAVTFNKALLFGMPQTCIRLV